MNQNYTTRRREPAIENEVQEIVDQELLLTVNGEGFKKRIQDF